MGAETYFDFMAQKLFLKIAEVNFHFHFFYKLWKLLLKIKTKLREPNIFLAFDFVFSFLKIIKDKSDT